MKTNEKILNFISQTGHSSVAQLTKKFKMSRQYIHRVLKDLEEKGLINKIGTAPKVLYFTQSAVNSKIVESISFEKEKFLKEHFILIDALGNLLEGLEAMQYWCNRQNLPLHKTIEEYISTRNKYLTFYNSDHLIDGLKKIQDTKGMGLIGVDELFYLDFYAIERFGKTRLGTLMHYAKQGQNKSLMKMIVSETRNSIFRLIHDKAIDAVVYIPPTIKRNLQIMDYLKKNFLIDLPHLKVDKLKSPIVVPQKALSKVFERVANAKNTFNVPVQTKYQNILMIDDAIGSGATINEIALKIKEKKIAQKVIGLAITGSYKGFEVISEL